MKKMTRKTRNIVLLSVGALLAGSLALAAQPIYQAINNNKKLAMPVRADVNHEVNVDEISTYLESNPVNSDVYILDTDILDIDYTKIFVTREEQQVPPEQDPVNPQDVVPPTEDEQDTPEEEQAEESEEANAITVNDNKVASTIIGITALVVTLGLAGFLASIIIKRSRKAKENE